MNSAKNSKKSKSDFSKAESCMYHYLENLARIEALRDDLKIVDAMSSLKVQNYDAQPSATGGHADDVAMRIVKIEMLESLILKAERWTKPITRMICDLESPYSSPEQEKMLKILHLRYLHGNTWERTAEVLELPRTTLYEHRDRLVWMAINYMEL